MPRAQKGFFTKEKVFFAAVFGIAVFLLSFFANSALSLGGEELELGELYYCSTSREIVSPSAVTLRSVQSIDEIVTLRSERYLYIRGRLPELDDGRLLLHTYSGTARVSVGGREIFCSINDECPGGTSYITAELDGSMSGEELELLLYTPLSNEFELRLIPAQNNIAGAHRASNAPLYLFAVGVLVLVAGLWLGLRPRSVLPRSAAVLCAVEMLLSLLTAALEYTSAFGGDHRLFNLKFFVYLMIPVLGIVECAVRCHRRSSRTEALLSINILYAVCVLFLGQYVFFFVLLGAGVFLQLANIIYVLHMLPGGSAGTSELCPAALIVFWGADLVFWFAVAFQWVSWQPLCFILSLWLYCMVAGFSARHAEHAKPGGAHVTDAANRSGGIQPRDGNTGAGAHAKNSAAIAEDVSDVRNAEETADAGARQNAAAAVYSRLGSDAAEDLSARLRKESDRIPLEAIDLFDELLMKKVFGKDRHSFNVAEYTHVICLAMGMSRGRAEEITKAAALHDIGKICVPEHILFKEEKLTEEEFAEIRRHTSYGYQLLDSTDNGFFRMAALVAREHHEHMDGSGYLGLRGSAISLPARIVAVADVFDALVSKRSYKAAWDFNRAFDYICEHDSDYYDRDAVAAFITSREMIYDLLNKIRNEF